ncbi:MAG: histidine kinase dimerization/phospho-acceptor domain-containing protein [Caldimonas sp.]
MTQAPTVADSRPANQLTLRLLVILLLIFGVVAGCIALVAQAASHNARRQALAEARTYFAARMRELDDAWRADAFTARQEVELWLSDSRSLDDAAIDDRLRVFLTTKLSHSEFASCAIDDGEGNLLFRYGTRSQDVTDIALERRDAGTGWAFSSKDRTVYRVLSGTIRYRRQPARMTLYVPIDNAVLRAMTYPSAHLALVHNGTRVAFTDGSGSTARASGRSPKGQEETADLSLAWGESPVAPVLKIDRDFVAPLSAAELALVMAGGAASFVLIAWLVLGRWIRSQTRRLFLLQRAASEFSSADRQPGDGVRLIDPDVTGGDDIGRLALRLREMMLRLDEGQAQRARASAALAALNASLEERVDARTRDLQAANEALEGSAEVTQSISRQLRQLTREQQAMLDNDLIGIVKVRDRSITWENRAIDRIFGHGSSGLIGKTLAVLHPDEAVDRSVQGAADAAFREGLSFRRQLRMVRHDGTLLWIDASSVLLSSSRVESMWLLADITEMRATQSELEQALFRAESATRAKSAFLANMSHELRTPMNAIIGFADLLHQGRVKIDEAKRHTFLGHIADSGRHLLQLINDVLDLAKAESGKMEFRPESLDLKRLVN